MRLVDFLSDLRDTSVRIAERGAYVYNDPDLCAALTVKTLLRPDVVGYFDSLLAQRGLNLSPSRALIYYLYLFAVAVNRRPQPQSASMPMLAQQAWRRLRDMDLSEDTCILAKPPRMKLPVFFLRKIDRLVGQETIFGLTCAYLAKAPTVAETKEFERSSAATLLIFPSPEATLTANSRRVTYSGRIFTAPTFRLDAFYLSAED